MDIGVVCSDLTEKVGDMLVDWYTSKERSSERRCTNRSLRVRAVKAAVAGFYSPDCLPVLEDSYGVEQKPSIPLSEPSEVGSFSLGDRVLQKGADKHVDKHAYNFYSFKPNYLMNLNFTLYS